METYPLVTQKVSSTGKVHIIIQFPREFADANCVGIDKAKTMIGLIREAAEKCGHPEEFADVMDKMVSAARLKSLPVPITVE